MLRAIEDVLLVQHPDYVLTYGDTNSTLAGALAASKLSIPVVHVEAGLRSFNRRMPEEINRVVVDHLSHLLLCPSQTAVNNLAAEGISWKVYADGMPSNCFRYNSGNYVARHNPALYYSDIGPSGDGTCNTSDVPYSSLDDDIAAGALPQFALIVPNVFHDMHSDAQSRACRLHSAIKDEVCQGDRWLRRELSGLLSDGGHSDVTVVIVFDEGLTSRGGGGHVMLLERGPGVCAGCRSGGSMNHYSLLHSIEDWFALPNLEPFSPGL